MNRFSYRMVWNLLAVAGFLAGCSNHDDDFYPNPKEEEPAEKPDPFVLKERQDIPIDRQQKEGVALQNDFAFRLFNADAVSNAQNSLISPLSMTMCLSMAANGASEEVKREIVERMLPDGGSMDDLNSLNRYLVSQLADVDNSSILTLANSVWVDKAFTLLPHFSETIKEYYNAESGALDMSSRQAADIINQWVNSTTNGLIPTLFYAPPACSMALINTMYFNGAWWDPFEEEFTEKGIFHNADGETKEVDFMHKNGNLFNMSITPEYSVLQLPYGNQAFSFYALLPAEGQDISLTPEKWAAIKKGMLPQCVNISVPKFEVAYDVTDLSAKMKEAGITKLFDAANPLQNTVTPQLPEGSLKMVHKTVFKVNEIGAEGAGLTAILWVTSPGPEYIPEPDPEIVLNRPFTYIVEEQSTGAILFIGAIRNL